MQSNGFNCYIATGEQKPVYLCPYHSIELIEIKPKSKKLICPECGMRFDKNKLKGEVLL